jgi:hypothetical protein
MAEIRHKYLQPKTRNQVQTRLRREGKRQKAKTIRQKLWMSHGVCNLVRMATGKSFLPFASCLLPFAFPQGSRLLSEFPGILYNTARTKFECPRQR